MNKLFKKVMLLFPLLLFIACGQEKNVQTKVQEEVTTIAETKDSAFLNLTSLKHLDTFKTKQTIDSSKKKKSKIVPKKLSDLYLEDVSYSLSPIPQSDVEPPIDNPGWNHIILLKIKNIGQADFYENLVISSNLFDNDENSYLYYFHKFKKKKQFKHQHPKIKAGETTTFTIRLIKDAIPQNKNVVFTINPSVCDKIPQGVLKHLAAKQKNPYRPIKESDYTNNSFEFFLGKYTDWALHGR